MALIQDAGVTLQRLDFSETSQVLVFFTREHGKVRAIGKGLKRSTKARFAVGIDLLEIGDLVLSVRQPRQEALAILTEWKPRRALAGLREKLARLYAAQYVAEITAALTEDWDPHTAVFDGLLAGLEALSEAAEVLGAVIAFQRLLLQEIGSWPEFAECVACRRRPPGQGDLFFSSLEGGLICRDCEGGHAEKRLVDRRALPLVRGETEVPAATTGTGFEATTQAAFDVLNYHIAHLMGKEPRLASKLSTAPRRSPGGA